MNSECRSCGAEIIWAVTENGRKMPVDAQPTTSGNLILEPGNPPLARYVAPWAGQHVSHFATCPGARKWLEAMCTYRTVYSVICGKAARLMMDSPDEEWNDICGSVWLDAYSAGLIPKGVYDTCFLAWHRMECNAVSIRIAGPGASTNCIHKALERSCEQEPHNPPPDLIPLAVVRRFSEMNKGDGDE